MMISRFVGNKACPLRGSRPSGQESAFQKADGKRQGLWPANVASLDLIEVSPGHFNPGPGDYLYPDKQDKAASSGLEMLPPAAVVRENGNALTGAGGPVETDRIGFAPQPRRVPLPQKRNEIKSFFPEIAFSGKIPLAESNSPGDCLIRFDTKFVDLERASEASAMSEVHPPLFRAQRSGSEKLFDKLRFERNSSFLELDKND